MQSKSDKITKVSLIRLQDNVEDSENSKTSRPFITFISGIIWLGYNSLHLFDIHSFMC